MGVDLILTQRKRVMRSLGEGEEGKGDVGKHRGTGVEKSNVGVRDFLFSWETSGLQMG